MKMENSGPVTDLELFLAVVAWLGIAGKEREREKRKVIRHGKRIGKLLLHKLGFRIKNKSCAALVRQT